jgi:uncharacterized protein (DUF305 family)
MSHRFLLFTAGLLSLTAATTLCQEAKPSDGGVSIVQPGAPGHSNKTLTPETATAPPRKPSEADVKFMQGMIMHHSQAVEMTELLKTRTHDIEVQALGKRISISQTDEMRFMREWLTERGESLSEHGSMKMAGNMAGDMAGMDMGGMDHDHMDMAMPMMPGMLTKEQMKALEAATGPEFDHLFLTGMIQHHTGALTMVKDLFRVPGAGQDPRLFDFASDVDNTQQAEIDIMRHMLKEKQ